MVTCTRDSRDQNTGLRLARKYAGSEGQRAVWHNRTMTGNSRLVLMAGFGGLLLLMAFAGFDGMQALQQIQTSNDVIREDFLTRTRLLERIRADVYVSGTYVRDYLLEPEAGKAEGHRYSLIETRADMDRRWKIPSLRPQEAGPFQALTGELTGLLDGAGTGIRLDPGSASPATSFCATQSFHGARPCSASPSRSATSTNRS